MQNKIIREVGAPEKDELISRMEKQWNVTEDYWFPLKPIDNQVPPPHTEAFQPAYFAEEFTYEKLYEILASHNVAKLYELNEDNRIWEIKLSEFCPVYGGLETFWFTDQLDWLVYASHEDSITIAGEWLLPEVKAGWANWEQRVWTTPFYQ